MVCCQSLSLMVLFWHRVWPSCDTWRESTVSSRIKYIINIYCSNSSYLCISVIIQGVSKKVYSSKRSANAESVQCFFSKATFRMPCAQRRKVSTTRVWSMLNTPSRFYTIWFARIRACKLYKLDFQPFLHILLHMIDFISHYKLMLCIIYFLQKLKYHMP